MRTIIRSAALAAVVLPVLLGARAASAQSIAGAWESSVPTQTRNEGGVETSSGAVGITITLEQRGDSVFGTWQRGKMEGRPDVPPRKLAGTFKDGVLTLVAEPQEAKFNRNGEESVMKLYTTYTLKLDGDAFAGTAKITADDDSFPGSERAFTMKRKA